MSVFLKELPRLQRDLENAEKDLSHALERFAGLDTPTSEEKLMVGIQRSAVDFMRHNINDLSEREARWLEDLPN